MNNNIMNIETSINSMSNNVDILADKLRSYSITYKKWIEFYLDYRVLKRLNIYGSEFINLSTKLGRALKETSVICTKEEQESYEEWKNSLLIDLGYSKKMEIN